MARSHRFVRKDPVLARSDLRCACKVVTALLLFSSVSAPSPVSAASGTADPARVAQGAAVADAPKSGFFSFNFLPWRKKNADGHVIEAEKPKAIETAAGPAPANSTKLWNAYLPSAGPAPLRFSAARVWPDAMPAREKAALAIALAPDPDVGLVAASDEASSTTATDTATPLAAAPQIVTTYTAASSSNTNSHQVVIDRQPLFLRRDYILTSDLVLNSLGNLSTDSAAVPTQFRPATPAVSSYESVPVAAAP